MKVENFVSKDFKILKASEAKISAFSSAVFYGYGAFTTIAIYNRKPFQWEKHWKRLTQDSQRLKLKLQEEEKVKEALLEVIEKNNLEQGRARITVFEETIEGLWGGEARQTSVLITTAQFRETPDEIRLKVSPYRINSGSALRGVKSCNYLENLLALEKAKSEGFDEALRLNEKEEVSSACMANVFWVEDEVVFTPSLETGCLEGTTRAFVIEICKDLGIEIYTVKETLNKLLLADEVFLTSSGIGIVPVRKIESEFFTSELTTTLRREFYKRVL
ncbi:MAG: hypothetical protein D6687_12000 [Acidobacteria bacterium]|nr:MAG: hypothetical protein D6687_12000 [Acidobacteriota bacterium]